MRKDIVILGSRDADGRVSFRRVTVGETDYSTFSYKYVETTDTNGDKVIVESEYYGDYLKLIQHLSGYKRHFADKSKLSTVKRLREGSWMRDPESYLSKAEEHYQQAHEAMAMYHECEAERISDLAKADELEARLLEEEQASFNAYFGDVSCV